MSNNISHDKLKSGGMNADNLFYRGVMTWLGIAVAVAAGSAVVVGPLIPPALLLPLALVLLVAMIVSAFSKKMFGLSKVFIFVVPAILGAVLYPTLDALMGSGQGGVIIQSLLATAVVFGTAAILGWRSDKNMSGWHGPLFAIVLGLIAVSLLNVFVFKLGIVSMLISAAIVVVFAIYSFIDVQAIRKRAYGDAPPQFYALQVFLDIYNIFAAMLNLLR